MSYQQELVRAQRTIDDLQETVASLHKTCENWDAVYARKCVQFAAAETKLRDHGDNSVIPF